MFLKRRSQIYFTDYIVAILIFVVFITIYHFYSQTIMENQSEDLNLLILEAKVVSNSLLSQGIPWNWSDYEHVNETTIRIGLMNEENVVYMDKLEHFYNMSYNISKYLFQIKNEFYVYMKNQNDEIIGINDQNGTQRK